MTALITSCTDRLFHWTWRLQAPQESGPEDAAWWERPARVLFVVFFIVGLPIMVNRAIQNGGSDFPDFWISGKYIVDHGVRHPHSEAARYLPSADVPWMALAWLPLPAAAVLYYVLGCWSWIGLLNSTASYLLPGDLPRAQRQATLLAGLLVMPLAIDGLCLGAFHIFMVWLMLVGLGRVARGEATWGGALLGLAIWVKLLPLLGVGYLVLKRQWKAALLALAVVVGLDVVLSVAAYGPRAAWQEHVQWWKAEGAGALTRQLTDPGVVDEDRLTNQSVAVTARRLLTRFGMEPDSPRNAATLADLSAGQLQAVYLAFSGLLGLALLWVCWRPGHMLTPRQWALEINLMLLATLWFSPVVWSYHPTAIAPALAMVLVHVDRHRRLVWAVALVWLLGLALLGSLVARAYGEMLWASLFVGGALVWLERKRERDLRSEI